MLRTSDTDSSCRCAHPKFPLTKERNAAERSFRLKKAPKVSAASQHWGVINTFLVGGIRNESNSRHLARPFSWAGSAPASHNFEVEQVARRWGSGGSPREIRMFSLQVPRFLAVLRRQKSRILERRSKQ